LINLPAGCRFAPRCMARVEYGLSICSKKRPELLDVAEGHEVRCWLYQDSESEKHVAPIKLERKS